VFSLEKQGGSALIFVVGIKLLNDKVAGILLTWRKLCLSDRKRYKRE